MIKRPLAFSLLLIIFLFSFSLTQAQKQIGTIYGNITDQSGVALELVNVGVINASKSYGASTDKSGNFSFTAPANKELEVAISYVGYATKLYKIKLKPNEKKQLNFSLEISKTTLKPIEIREDNTREEGITRIKTQWTGSVVGPTEGVEGLVKTFEGVSSNNELSSQYSVRGGNYDENLVYVNDIEIFRPFLIRSGQQEGLSFVNSDMVGDILFSSGGFDAKYGDKMSSVLDIKYRKPQDFAGSASLSLLGGSVHLEGLIGKKMTYQIGYRRKTNKYILSSLETQGSYYPVFNDLQAYFTYDINSKWEVDFLGTISDNKYQFIPQTRETTFGNIYSVQKLKVYFDGQELDRFISGFGALQATYKPSKDLNLKIISSFFTTDEKENYDIQGQYWLSETGLGQDSQGEDTAFDKGIGTYLEHARNRLRANIFNLEQRGMRFYDNGTLSWGLKVQREIIKDKMNEWKMVDSAGYTIPSISTLPGQEGNQSSPLLQNIYHSDNDISSTRLSAFGQRTWRFASLFGDMYVNVGARWQYWTFNKENLISPRASISLKPYWKQDWLFRFSTGVYSQSPFFREYRDYQGNINYDIKSQKSLHFVLSLDHNFKMFSRPFKFLVATYYKYLWDLIPYSVDNVRIRYSAQNNAIGYAAGIDARLFGEFIEGIDSWVTMSLMRTEENIKGDSAGFIPRPTDQLLNMNVSFQDYVPNMPYLRVYLNFNFGTGYPYGVPNSERKYQTYRMPSYMRADMAFTFRLKDENSKWAKNNFMHYIKKIWLNLEWFNIFNNKNVISYTWVSDYNGHSYGVPNYLTPSQLNCKLTFEF